MYYVVEVWGRKSQDVAEYEDLNKALTLGRNIAEKSGCLVEIQNEQGKVLRRIKVVDDRDLVVDNDA